MREGFKGPIYMTPPTASLAELILRDSAHIVREEAEQRGLPVLYDDRDVSAAFARVETVEYHRERELGNSLSFIFRNTGHILGSASVRLKASDGTAVALTGDIGNSPSPLLPDWEPVTDADAVVMESVYGDRVHPDRDGRVERLRNLLKEAIGRGGAILIPAFSLERTQLMLYELSNFFDAGELPKVPVFLDSPLAISVTKAYEKWGETYFNADAQAEEEREKSLFRFPFLTMTPDRTDSDKIAETRNPKIIIAGAGMSHGGRIGRHEARYLPDPKSTLIIVGYQAPGSPGRLMQEGAKHVRLGRHDVRLAAKVAVMEGWSAHADRDELMQFAEACLADKRPKAIFTALGEPASARFLAQRIHDYLGVTSVVPVKGESWEITKEAVRRAKA
jgi:metallo-beta-lactamase family protein